jgi:hypothetical protein
MQIQSPSPKRKAEPSAATVSVYYCERYIGHVLARGYEGFEAYYHTERSLGIFKTEDDATTAIWKAAQ